MSVTCYAHLTLFDLIIIIFGEEDKYWSSSLSNFMHTSATFSRLGQNILTNTLISNIFSLCSSFNIETKFQTHTKQQEN
jgi:hypothetical protein